MDDNEFALPTRHPRNFSWGTLKSSESANGETPNAKLSYTNRNKSSIESSETRR